MNTFIEMFLKVMSTSAQLHGFMSTLWFNVSSMVWCQLCGL